MYGKAGQRADRNVETLQSHRSAAVANEHVHGGRTALDHGAFAEIARAGVMLALGRGHAHHPTESMCTATSLKGWDHAAAQCRSQAVQYARIA